MALVLLSSLSFRLNGSSPSNGWSGDMLPAWPTAAISRISLQVAVRISWSVHWTASWFPDYHDAVRLLADLMRMP